MRRLLLVLLLLATGCSLPLPDGVKTVQGAPEEQQQRQNEILQVIPPGPKEGQTPEEIVRGFLAAQASAEDDHAIARSFLTSTQAAAWDDGAGVAVYDLNSQRVSVLGQADGEATATVRLQVTGQIADDGGYTARAETTEETYRLQDVEGQWRLSDVPAGLRLTAADSDRSFRAQNVFYPAQVPAEAPPHLVPDRVFLPVGADAARVLVDRVLAAPSQALAGSVAHRGGLRAVAVTTAGSGVVTVDLDGTAGALAGPARQALSAQLVWTLRQLGPRFSGLRLLAGGTPLRVPGQGAVQEPDAWDSWDPDGLGLNPPYFFVASRRLRSSAALPSNSATAGDVGDPQTIPVDAVAVTPDRTQMALLDGIAPGPVTVRLGPLRGPTYRRVVSAVDLRSPTWGSADAGLWLVHRQRDVVLLPTGATALRVVPVVGRPAGPLRSLAISRDGARAALVLGQQLYVGRVQATGSGPRITGLRRLSTSAAAVAWVTGTELAVLSRTSAGAASLLRTAVDGSASQPLNAGGLAVSQLTAAPAGLLLAARGSIYSLVGRGPARVAGGTAPAYPG